MEYLYYYFAGVVLLMLGYMIGVRDERKHGSAAAQKALDKEIEHFNEEVRLWGAVEDALPKETQKIRKAGKTYKHLRLVK
jgi:hypothetical protein